MNSAEDVLKEVGREVDEIESTCAANVRRIRALSLEYATFTAAEREIIAAAEAQIAATVRVLHAVHTAATRRSQEPGR